MREAAVRKAKHRLEQMRKSHEQLISLLGCHDVEPTWADLIMAANSIYLKIEAGAKGAHASNEWFKLRRVERNSDPLLQYVHQARNADEHGIESLVEVGRPEFSVASGVPYTVQEDHSALEGSSITVMFNFESFETAPQIMWRPQPSSLREIRNRGRDYPPPNEHLGVRINGKSIRVVAELTLSYTERLVHSAERLLLGWVPINIYDHIPNPLTATRMVLPIEPFSVRLEDVAPVDQPR